MKVNIGPYTSWIGPYQIAEKLLFWLDKYEDEEKRDYIHRFGKWLAEDKDGNDSWLTKLCYWIEKHRPKRKIKIKIDYYDTWSLDHTIALIVAPMLIQLRDTTHGYGLVDDEDVPEELRSTSAPPKENEWDLDNNAEKRWNWAINEMIWAFEEHNKEDGESQFFDHGEVDKKEDLEEQIRKIKVDREGLDAYNKRKANGFRLFGKYFQSLWD